VILAIDPGPEQSAYVRYQPSDRSLVAFGKVSNETMLRIVGANPDQLVVELIASYGMPVGREVFDTCIWTGRFIQQWHREWKCEHETLTRGAVKMHMCGSMRAKDGNVRQALLDAWGGKDKALGSKRAPGPLSGVSGDVWAALGVAVTYADRTEQARAA
jgi:hypothetical protein